MPVDAQSIRKRCGAPNQFPAIAYKKGLSDHVYPSYSEFLWDIAPIFKAEMQALASEGVRYIQIDAPRYSYYLDPKWRQYVQENMGVARGILPDSEMRKRMAEYVEAL